MVLGYPGWKTAAAENRKLFRGFQQDSDMMKQSCRKMCREWENKWEKDMAGGRDQKRGKHNPGRELMKT